MKKNSIIAVSNEQGVAKITKYATNNLILPTLELIKRTYIGGTCCVMTVTNNEALIMTGVLNKNGFKAKLIQSSDGFNLLNLYELRCFVEMLGDPYEQPVIQNEVWDAAIENFERRFSDSSCLNECLSLLESFAETNREKYYSDLIEYIQESNLEDFSPQSKDTILVSTIHKTKGREFDTVYMMLNNFRIRNDSNRHAVYVGVTRARHSLYINCNTNIFDTLEPGMTIPVDRQKYPEPDEAMLQLTHTGVNLGYFKYIKTALTDLHCGQYLIERNGNMLTDLGSGKKCVAKLSKSSMSSIAELKKKGFDIYRSEIRFLVYWKGKNEDDEVLCVLPNLYLRKAGY